VGADVKRRKVEEFEAIEEASFRAESSCLGVYFLRLSKHDGNWRAEWVTDIENIFTSV
jgi:hypothetical protein